MAPPLPRRDFLKGLGATAAASAIGCGPEPLPLEPGRIDHVVLVMMENRTFDQFLGALSLLEGRDDVDGLADGMANPDPLGGPDLPIFHAEVACLPDPPHGWDASHRQHNDGAMDGFTAAYHRSHPSADPALVMGYHTREDLPITFALADAYTISERWFASLMCQTWPNRLYALAGESQGLKSNSFPPGTFSYDIPTLFHRLDEVGASWGAYSQNASSLWLWGDLRGRPELQSFERFLLDCERGTLPAVSWVEPAFGINDDHPPAHPMLGQIFLATVHQALAASPAWERTLLVITYDEHGGLFDHVPPPKVHDARAADGFDQLGFRVPALICGPWARRGHVDATQREHTSVLAHLAAEHGFAPLGSREAEDLWSAIDTDRLAANQPHAPATLPTLPLSEEDVEALCASVRGRSLDQALLEEALDRFPAPPHLDRRHAPEQVAADALAHAVALGVISVAGSRTSRSA